MTEGRKKEKKMYLIIYTHHIYNIVRQEVWILHSPFLQLIKDSNLQLLIPIYPFGIYSSFSWLHSVGLKSLLMKSDNSIIYCGIFYNGIHISKWMSLTNTSVDDKVSHRRMHRVWYHLHKMKQDIFTGSVCSKTTVTRKKITKIINMNENSVTCGEKGKLIYTAAIKC